MLLRPIPPDTIQMKSCQNTQSV